MPVICKKCKRETETADASGLCITCRAIRDGLAAQQSDIEKTMRERRLEAGFSQEQLAARLKVSNGAISNWESGAALPRPRHLKRLAQIFNLPVGELREQLKAALQEKK